jgi:hypothetical protein
MSTTLRTDASPTASARSPHASARSAQSPLHLASCFLTAAPLARSRVTAAPAVSRVRGGRPRSGEIPHGEGMGRRVPWRDPVRRRPLRPRGRVVAVPAAAYPVAKSRTARAWGAWFPAGSRTAAAPAASRARSGRLRPLATLSFLSPRTDRSIGRRLPPSPRIEACVAALTQARRFPERPGAAAPS